MSETEGKAEWFHYVEKLAPEGLEALVSPAFSYSTVLTLQLKFLIISAFNPWGEIGSTGSRNFVLSKKSESQNLGDSVETTATRKTSGKWKAWLNKSLGLMVPSH